MKHIFVKAISYSLILLFLYAAANKLIDYQKFTIQINQSPILRGYGSFIALPIPVLEIIISVMLAFANSRLFALYFSFFLMTLFSAYIFIIMNFAEHIPCSCGGILDKMSWDEHLVFNIAFAILALVGILLQSSIQHNHIKSYTNKNFFGQETGLTENL